MQVIKQEQLPLSMIARALGGAVHGGLGVSILFVDAPPGRGARLHKHPYEEVFIVEEGQALFVAGGSERRVGAGDIVVVPAGTPHRFVNSGEGPLRQVDIHVSDRFVTQWLDPPQRGAD